MDNKYEMDGSLTNLKDLHSAFFNKQLITRLTWMSKHRTGTCDVEQPLAAMQRDHYPDEVEPSTTEASSESSYILRPNLEELLESSLTKPTQVARPYLATNNE